MSFAVLCKERFYGWVTLSGTALVFFLMAGILMYSLGVFLPFICKEFGWSRGTVAGAYTTIMVVMGLSGPLAGMFIAKYGPRRAIILGNLMSALGLLLLAFHSRLWQFYVGYGVLIGLGVGIGGFLATTTIANNWFMKKRSLAISIVMSSGGIGGLVLVPVIMAMIVNVGWRSTYIVLSAIILIFGVVVSGLLIRNKPEDLGQIPDGASARGSEKTVSAGPIRGLYQTPVDFTAGEALRTRALWLLVGLATAFTFALSMLMAHQVVFLVDMGVPAGMAAAALGLLPGTSTVGRVGIGILGLKYNMRSLTIGSTVVLTIGMALVLLTKSLPMVFIYTTVFGIGSGALGVATVNLRPVYFGRANYSKIVGLTSPFAIIGFVGAPIAGAMHDATGSYKLPFTIATLALLGGLACIIFARPPTHPTLMSR